MPENLGDFTEPRFQPGLLVDEGGLQREVFVYVRIHARPRMRLVANDYK